MAVQVYNFTIYQGARTVELFQFRSPGGAPVNLTGYTLVCHFRLNVSSPTIIHQPALPFFGPAANGDVQLIVESVDSFVITENIVYDIRATAHATLPDLVLVEGMGLINLAVSHP